jgi:exoribonuclease-2
MIPKSRWGVAALRRRQSQGRGGPKRGEEVLSIQETRPQVNGLVLYKVRPARVLALGEKIEIELEGGQTKRVRPKDIEPLHPGPLARLADLTARQGSLDEAWELLEGGETDLKELAEILYGDFSPASAWAAWQEVADGLYFSGTPRAIQVRPREAVEQDRAQREAKAAAERDWAAFLARMEQGRAAPEDRERLGEVERLATGQTGYSRILVALGHQESPANAHRLLVKLGYWSPDHNPYPARCGVARGDPQLPVGDLPEEARLDLTGLAAYAIDDEGNQDPDDAIGLEGDRLWVHVADVAALVPPDSDLDLEARSRGANLYLPEGIVNMLPQAVTDRLGLGLQPTSPALSFGMRCGAEGEPTDIEVRPTLIRAQRLTYAEVDADLDAAPFAAIDAFLRPFRARREARGAAGIDLPEVSVRVRDGEVVIRPLERSRSRNLVMDAMLMAGEACARWCLERGIAIPFAGQVAPDKAEAPQDLAGMYAHRRRFKPTRLSVEPVEHSGLGLALYTRATSPLRRYSDLLVHQQVRLGLAGGAVLDARQVSERVGEAEVAGVAVRRAERLSNHHWKLVYLSRHPGWEGEGVVVGVEERKVVVLIPGLALDAKVRAPGAGVLNDRLRLVPREIDLPELDCYFRVTG